MSNIVELSSSLTLKEKLNFYKEMIPDLLSYAEVLFVKESNESLIIKEQQMIIEYLSAEVKKVASLTDKVLKFEFDKVLDDTNVWGFK